MNKLSEERAEQIEYLYYQLEMYRDLERFIDKADSVDFDEHAIKLVVDDVSIIADMGVEYTILRTLKAEKNRLLKNLMNGIPQDEECFVLGD